MNAPRQTTALLKPGNRVVLTQDLIAGTIPHSARVFTIEKGEQINEQEFYRLIELSGDFLRSSLKVINANDFTLLPLYRSHKVIGAAKIKLIDHPVDQTGMTRIFFDPETCGLESVLIATSALANKPTPKTGDWYVEYMPTTEGGKSYFSFSPDAAFIEGNSLMTAGELVDEQAEADLEVGMYSKPGAKFDFGAALDFLKDGELVTREGWNGKGMFLFLVNGSRFKVNRAPLDRIFAEGTEIDYRPHIDMKTVDGQIVPWVASQSDLMADDWMLADIHGMKLTDADLKESRRHHVAEAAEGALGVELVHHTYKRIIGKDWPGGTSPEIVALLKHYSITDEPGSEEANLALQKCIIANPHHRP